MWEIAAATFWFMRPTLVIHGMFMCVCVFAWEDVCLCLFGMLCYGCKIISLYVHALNGHKIESYTKVKAFFDSYAFSIFSLHTIYILKGNKNKNRFPVALTADLNKQCYSNCSAAMHAEASKLRLLQPNVSISWQHCVNAARNSSFQRSGSTHEPQFSICFFPR